MDEENSTKKIKTASLVLMIFSSIFGFSNSLTAYYQMGYASMIWYIVTAILFFLPSAIMFAEYGASFKAARGGIFSWMRGSVGEKPAFIGTFIWLSAWVVWLVSSTQYFLVSISTMLFGSDKTQTWHLLGLDSNQTLGIMEIAFLAIVTYLSSRGIDKIAKVASVCGVFTLGIAAVFILASLAIWVMDHGATAEPVTAVNFIKSPNSAFISPIAIISFIVYALFAYGGLETMAGVIDSVDKPERTFPRALIIGMVIMTLLYVLAIFMCGVTTNWHEVLGKKSVDLANVEYVLINNMGLVAGSHLGLSHATSVTLGRVFSQITALSDVFGGLGAAFVMTYSPIKSFVEGCDPRLLPDKLTSLNKAGMPAFAMWMQMIVVSVIVFFITFGGKHGGDLLHDFDRYDERFLFGTVPVFDRGVPVLQDEKGPRPPLCLLQEHDHHLGGYHDRLVSYRRGDRLHLRRTATGRRLGNGLLDRLWTGLLRHRGLDLL